MSVVWRAEEGEAATVAGLLVEFRDWFGRDWPSEESFHTGVRRLIADPAVVYLLGSTGEGSPAAGVCQLRFRYGLWHTAEDCWLEDLFVRAEARGSGLGRALAEAAVDLARDRGCARVELDVNEANRPARALYEALGFASGKDGSEARDLLMRRRLSS